MQFQIASLVKLVAVSGVVLWLWCAYGIVGVAAAGVVTAMVLVPVGVARLGGSLGEPIIAGALGGAIGWGLLALAIYVLVPGRLTQPPFSTFVPVGMLIGGLYGLAVVFRHRASKKLRVARPRRALGLDLGLLVVLVLLLFGWPLIEPYRMGFLSGLMRAVKPAVQPKSETALPKRILPAEKSSRSVTTLANAAPGTKMGA